MKSISRKTTVQLLKIILSAIVVFHVLVLVKVIPYTVVWGGKFPNYEAVLPYEIASLLLNFSFILLVWFRAKRPASKSGRIGLWLMFGVFALNTLGNLFAESLTEKLIATPVTLGLALLSLRLALKPNPESLLKTP